MRLSHYVAGGLILILMLGAMFFYVNPMMTGHPNGENNNRITQAIDGETRIQGIHFHREDGELALAYLYSYEPISERFAAIYLPPDISVVSSSLANVRTLAELYDSMDPETLRSELSIILDVPIPLRSETRDDQLSRIVDLLGGTRIPDPETAVDINLADTESLSGEWIDGQMALDYVSNSYNDFGIQGLRYRHKTFFLGLLQWLNERDHLLNHPETYRTIHSMLKTNLSTQELRSLIHTLTRMEAEKIKIPAAGGNYSGERNHLSGDRIKNMLPRPLKNIIEESEPQETIKVQILNGSGIEGLAGELRTFLQKFARVDVIEVGNANRYDYETTQIIDRSGNPQSAYHLMEILNAGEYEEDQDPDLLVDVTIIVGRDLQKIRFR